MSFWFDNYQTSLEDLDREKEIISELATELEIIEKSTLNRDSVFRYDSENLKNIIDGVIKNSNFSYSELLIAATDYRGFGPSEEIYTSLKYDGGLKFIRNKKVKIAIESLYKGTKYGVVANMEDEIFVQKEILKYIQFNYPGLLIDVGKMKIQESKKIKIFSNIVQKDKTLKALLVSKLRFMDSKLLFLQRYKNSLFELKKLLKVS